MGENEAGSGSAGGVEPAATPAVESATPAAVSGEAPGGSAPSAAFDPAAFEKRLEERISARDQEWQGYLRQSQEASQKAQKEFNDRMLSALNPEYARQVNQPRYATVDQITQMQRQFQERITQQQLFSEYTSGLGAAREKYASVFDAYPGLEHAIGARWRETGESPVKIAAEIDQKLKGLLAKSQADLIKNKQAMQGTVQGSGSPGKAPDAPSGDHGIRGRERLRAIRLGKI